MKKVHKIWMFIGLIFIGYSGGIITGVVVDVDSVYHTTVKKLKQKNSRDGTIVVEVDTTIEAEKSKKELRIEKRTEKRLERKERKNTDKMKE